MTKPTICVYEDSDVRVDMIIDPVGFHFTLFWRRQWAAEFKTADAALRYASMEFFL
jgi:hypothetical protein